MSRQGREAAIKHAQSLPSFSSRVEAERSLFAQRDRHLAFLSKLAEGYEDFDADFAPESLRALERWYFTLYEDNAFHQIGATRETFETCMAMYFGETAVRNTSARWIVEEYFLAKGRFELGIRKSSMTMMLSRLTDHFAEPNNKRQESLYRRYKKHFVT